ncbi:hypothetical protein BZA70DRAFT_287793 [Myxozyma melibiosi]|uniref:Fumarylacetoacetase-like C-terminal domain-containing protein n=1 Tax=Myxozyma melibiosi TaxID=54550 RepID=A0ABR1FF61_9ASCO
MAAPLFKRLVRFIPKSSPSKILIGQPKSDSVDVGRALYQGQDVAVEVFSGNSMLSPGENTSEIESIGKLLSPMSQSEVGTVRCIGLNYRQHALEVKMAFPEVPVVFMKPATAVADPWPSPTTIPLLSQLSNTADYESELAVVLGKDAKNVKEEDAMDCVLGYTAANDVSSRGPQFQQSQWVFSKSFDGSCPLGPTLVSKSLIQNPSALQIKGLKNGRVMQESSISDLIFDIPKIISFLSQSTTLPAGTVILTGTPAGVAMGSSTAEYLKDGDTFEVEISPHIGTLVNVFENE